MSDRNLARRVSLRLFFQRANVTAEVGRYLLSLVYSDSEEDEADDLQLQLQDRDDLWLEQWMLDAVDAAASAPAASAAANYKVTAKIGLNVRSGPGTAYACCGTLPFGAAVQVSELQNGWGKIRYSGKDAYVSAAYLEQQSAGATGGGSGGFVIQAAIIAENWHSDGRDYVLDCGEFELDDISGSGPPDTITVKSSALPYSTPIRQTPRSRAWEHYRLSGMIREIAAAHGMACLYLAEQDPEYPRVEQYKTSDIAFLSGLCRTAGLSLKVTNRMLVVFDQAVYAQQPGVRTIRKGDGSYTKYTMNVGKAKKQYDACRVSYVDPKTGKCIAAVAVAENAKTKEQDRQQLEIRLKVQSVGEAQAQAEKYLRLHNKFTRTMTFTLPGDPTLAAGQTVEVAGWGAWAGRYLISKAVHTVGPSGYTTKIELRKVLEGS